MLLSSAGSSPLPESGRGSTVLDRVFGEDLLALVERLGGSLFGFHAASHHLVQRGLKNMFGVHLGGGRVIGRVERNVLREEDLIDVGRPVEVRISSTRGVLCGTKRPSV